LQAFAHHSTHSALEASTFQSLNTRFAHQLIAASSVEQNSIGHTQIIISQDFKWMPEGLAYVHVKTITCVPMSLKLSSYPPIFMITFELLSGKSISHGLNWR
jgi:hypothetical protein